MPKRPKAGPPYTDIPDEVYVVVANPWGMDIDPRSRRQGDFNRIASWARFALYQAGLSRGQAPAVECIYGMGTRDEVILQFPKDTNVIPLLGRHRWADFWNRCVDPNDPRSTRVFMYNWRNNGDPANHNWTENFPESLALNTVPAKSPYPIPSWTLPPSNLTNLVLPIPRPLNLPQLPDPAHNPDEGQQSAMSAATSASLFRPYEPLAQHPSHAQFLSQPQCQDGKASSPKFIKKLDPYELDEDALEFIRLPVSKEEDTKEVKQEIRSTAHFPVKLEVKTEEDAHHAVPVSSGYQPSRALIDAFHSLRGHEEPSPPSLLPPTRDTHGISAEVKTEEIDDHNHHAVASNSGYQPSRALIDAVSSLSAVPTPSAGGLDADANLAVSPPTGGDSRITPGTRTFVKREYENDAVAFPRGKRQKIKVEEV